MNCSNQTITDSERPKADKARRNAAVFEKPGYWMTPAGSIFPVSPSHISCLKSRPEQFGYTREEFDSIYEYHRSILKQAGRVREAVIREVVLSGFIRIRRYPDRWSVNIARLDPVCAGSLTRFAQMIMGKGIDGIVETDPETPVRILCFRGGHTVETVMIGDIANGALLAVETPSPVKWVSNATPDDDQNSSKPSWKDIRRRYNELEDIQKMVFEMMRDKKIKLTTIRDRVLSLCSYRKIDTYMLISWMVDSMAVSIGDQIGRGILRPVDSETFIDWIRMEDATGDWPERIG